MFMVISESMVNIFVSILYKFLHSCYDFMRWHHSVGVCTTKKFDICGQLAFQHVWHHFYQQCMRMVRVCHIFVTTIRHLGMPGWLSGWASAISFRRDLGIESHIGLLAGSLLLPLPMSLPLSLCVSHELINKIFKNKK